MLCKDCYGWNMICKKIFLDLVKTVEKKIYPSRSQNIRVGFKICLVEILDNFKIPFKIWEFWWSQVTQNWGKSGFTHQMRSVVRGVTLCKERKTLTQGLGFPYKGQVSRCGFDWKSFCYCLRDTSKFLRLGSSALGVRHFPEKWTGMFFGRLSEILFSVVCGFSPLWFRPDEYCDYHTFFMTKSETSEEMILCICGSHSGFE